jgi:arsenate reductase
MAEGFLNSLYGEKYEGHSAGIQPTKINPYVVKVMTEVGVDLSRNRSKSIEEFNGINFNFVITVCDHAKEVCPFFPGEIILHKGFEDPSEIKGTENEILSGVRLIRDEIKDWIIDTFGKTKVKS